jgi:hypothetical protein
LITNPVNRRCRDPFLAVGARDISSRLSAQPNGAIMGAERETFSINTYLQNWDVPNIFVHGASAFLQNAGTTRPIPSPRCHTAHS